MATITLRALSKRYPNGHQAVDRIDLAIQDKEFVVLVGPSGCGKSTTLRMIAGLEDISEGTISVGDRVVNHLAPKDRNVAMVFQNHTLYPHMNVRSNIAFALKLRKVAKTEIDKRVLKAADTLGLTSLLDRSPQQLSGGQRQRVAVGRAIVMQPEVFLFDEPLSNLDATLRVTMRAKLSRWQRQLETTMLYVTHDQVEAMTMGNRIVVMKDGAIQQIGKPMEVYSSPSNMFVANFIGSPPMNFFPGRLILSDGTAAIDLGCDTLRLPPQFVPSLEKRLDSDVVAGLRPEHITSIRPDNQNGLWQSLNASVEGVQPQGSEIILQLSKAEHQFIATADSHTRTTINDSITVYLDMSEIHLFDPFSEEAIVENRRKTTP